MASPALATGAGAGLGLEQLLARQMKEEEMRRQMMVTQEALRHNRADEGLKGREIDVNSGLRDATLKATEAQRQSAADAQQRDDYRENIKLIPAGTPVSEGDYQDNLKHGVPSALFNSETIDSQGPTEDGQPLPPGTLRSFRGTAAELKPTPGVSDQVKTVTYQGKPVDASYDPKTQKYTYKGQDITNDISHYEKPAAPIPVITVDNEGNAVTKITERTPGKEFTRPASAVTQNRVTSAKTVNDVGQHIIDQLSDPNFASTLGPALGRYNSIKDFIGNPPPEYSELAGEIESYALANMGVHGMRSAQGAAMISKLMDQKHTPESLAGSVRGLSRFSQDFIKNANPKAGAASSAKDSGVKIISIEKQ